MATVLKCKMCGGDIEVNQDMTVGTCLFCGSTMTLPKIDSEKKARLFNRANQYRLNNEFDKAYDAYEAIVQEDEQEAEAYWGLVLSEYGVEYVEEAKTGKRIPTCHRTKVQSITSSVNYKQALQYADAESRFIYQDEAEVLDKLQKNIISVSAKEEPYDVFICYKETDEKTGERSKDSVLAQQIYDALQEKGIRTFFARISLEDKVGQNYEPFIYAALNSARVMLLVTTNNENCNAVWVKNEWKRYLDFMEGDKNKAIIPVCSEMSPYELPDELTSFQAQIMDKVGAIQDLVYGVTKLLGKAPRESNNQIINELLSDKASRDKRTKLINRALIAAVIAICYMFTLLFISRFSNGYVRIGFKEMYDRFPNIVYLFFAIFGLGNVLNLASLVHSIFKGYTHKRSRVLFFLGFATINVSLLISKIMGFRVVGTKYALIVNFIVLIGVLIAAFKTCCKKETAVGCIILILCSVMGLTDIGFDNAKISNYEEVLAENQLVVTAWYSNIRKDPSTKSNKLGEVYQNMVFDIVSEYDDGTHKWYEINTNNGINGYIREDMGYKSVKILITDEYINVREGCGTSYDLIGKVHKGEQYISSSAEEHGSRTWYRITLKDGKIGYIGAEGIQEIK